MLISPNGLKYEPFLAIDDWGFIGAWGYTILGKEGLG